MYCSGSFSITAGQPERVQERNKKGRVADQAGNKISADSMPWEITNGSILSTPNAETSTTAVSPAPLPINNNGEEKDVLKEAPAERSMK